MAGSASAGSAASEPAPRACFPARIGDLQAVEYAREDHDAMHRNRLGKIFGYNGAPYGTTVTVYLMDKSRAGSAEQEFRSAGSQILAVHPGAELVMSDPARPLTLAARPTAGQMATYRWKEGGDDVGSILWIGETPDRIVKIRLSYSRPQGKTEAEVATRYVTQTLRATAEHVCE